MTITNICARLRKEGFYKESNRIENCGKIFLALKCKGCGGEVIRKLRCCSKLCEDCVRVRALRLRSEWMETIANMEKMGYFRLGYTWKLLTVTLKHEGSIVQRVDLIKIALKKLFREMGGHSAIVVLEISGEQHVHCHAVCYAPYRDIGWISSRWRELTGSYIVRYEVLRSRDNGMRYIFKYIAKGDISFSAWKQLKHRRMVWAFGKIHGMKEKLKFCCSKCLGSFGVQNIGVIFDVELLVDIVEMLPYYEPKIFCKEKG